MLSRNAAPRASADYLFKFKQVRVTARSYETSTCARERGYPHTRKPTRMQHRRERPTPRRQTHPPETPQTHLHPRRVPRSLPQASNHPPRSPARGGIPIASPVSQTHTTHHTTPRYPPTSPSSRLRPLPSLCPL